MLLQISKSDFIRTEHIVKYEILTSGSRYQLQALITTGAREFIVESPTYEDIYNIMLELEKETSGKNEVLYLEDVIQDFRKRQMEERIKQTQEKENKEPKLPTKTIRESIFNKNK